jgi:hypothetical protein
MSGQTDKGTIKSAYITATASILVALIALVGVFVNGHYQKQLGIAEGINHASINITQQLADEYVRGFSDGEDSLSSFLTEEYSRGFYDGNSDKETAQIQAYQEGLKERQDSTSANNSLSGGNLSNTDSNTSQQIREVYLNESLTVYSSKYYNGTWYSGDLCVWDRINSKAADGNTYKNVAYFALTHLHSIQVMEVTYLLDRQYQTLNFIYMLDEDSKSTATIARMRIYDEDDNLIYESSTITGGMPPQDVKDLDVSNVTLLKIMFISENGYLGYRQFGVVWVDPVLTIK